MSSLVPLTNIWNVSNMSKEKTLRFLFKCLFDTISNKFLRKMSRKPDCRLFFHRTCMYINGTYYIMSNMFCWKAKQLSMLTRKFRITSFKAILVVLYIDYRWYKKWKSIPKVNIFRTIVKYVRNKWWYYEYF